MKKTIYLDCDSTLCAIEGVDELAAIRGKDIEKKVIELTNQAMDGTVPIDEVFARRLDLIQPSLSMCKDIGQMYIERLSDGVEEALEVLRKSGWTPVIISGGFTQVIQPVADQLGIKDVHAVTLKFDEDGNYSDFDREAPTARNGGKPDIIKSLHSSDAPHLKVMVGDGVSDWETSPVVDLFVGYGGVVSRPLVKERSKAFIHSFGDLIGTIESYLH